MSKPASARSRWSVWKLALCCAVLTAACGSKETVEQQIIGVINEMEQSAEAGERGEFMDRVAADFSGQEGEVTRDQLNALILYQLNRHRRVQVQLFPIMVKPDGPDRAVANMHVLLTGGPKRLPDRGRMYDVSSRWQLRDGDWLLVGARWKPVALDSVLE